MIDFSQYKVMIVDDEIDILKALNRDLRTEPYEKIFLSSGKDALDLIEKGEEISLIITDMRMPGMNGLELLSHISAMSPETVMIVLTGYTQLPQVLATVNKVEIFKFLTKPWNIEVELKLFIREGIELYEMRKKALIKQRVDDERSKVYNKMLVDSYEKADFFLKNHHELLKAINYHHILTMQEIRRYGFSVNPETEPNDLMEPIKDRMYYINKIFDYERSQFKDYDLKMVVEGVQHQLADLGKNTKFVQKASEHNEIYHGSMKTIVNIISDLVETVLKKKIEVQSVVFTARGSRITAYISFELEGPYIELYSSRGKFVQQLVKTMGGLIEIVEKDVFKTLAIELPVHLKKESTLEQ